jgi:hypothetical protein
MKPVIAALTAAFLLVSAGDVLAQNAPTYTEQQKSPSSSTAVDCHKIENAKNQVCMKAARDQTAAQARRAIRR